MGNYLVSRHLGSFIKLQICVRICVQILHIYIYIYICMVTDQNHVPRVHVPMLSDPEGLDRVLDPEGVER